MLQLTSYNRIRRYVGASSALTDTKFDKQMLVNWILATSKQIETFLGRWLAIASYTEYFDTRTANDLEFLVKGYPISTLTSVYVSGDGLWEGEESVVDDCFIGRNNNSVLLPVSPSVFAKKSHRVIYTGGLAYNGVRSVFTLTESAGTWTVGNYVYGGTSEAVGIIKAVSATSMTVEVLYGIFEAAETLTEYTDEDLTSVVAGASATLSAISQQSLAESYPDIIRACEIQVRHYWKHKDDFEASSTNKDGTNQRRLGYEEKSILIPEAISLLMPYRNLVI